MRLAAVIAAFCGVVLWLWATPAVARSTTDDDGTVSADKKNKHKHRDGGSELDEEREEELRAF